MGMHGSGIEKKDKRGSTRAPIARKKVSIVEARITHIKLCWPPTDEQKQNQLGDELLQWAYLQESTRIEDFPISKFMNPYRFRTLCDKNEYFKDCYELACYLIGTRLQEGVHKRTLDKDLSLQMLPLYHREFKQWKIESRKQEPLPETGNKIIVVERAASSPLVPERNHERRDTDPFEQVQTEVVPTTPDGRTGE